MVDSDWTGYSNNILYVTICDSSGHKTHIYYPKYEIPTNVWLHIAIAIDGTNGPSLYVNGIYKGGGTNDNSGNIVGDILISNTSQPSTTDMVDASAVTMYVAKISRTINYIGANYLVEHGIECLIKQFLIFDYALDEDDNISLYSSIKSYSDVDMCVLEVHRDIQTGYAWQYANVNVSFDNVPNKHYNLYLERTRLMTSESIFLTSQAGVVINSDFKDSAGESARGMFGNFARFYISHEKGIVHNANVLISTSSAFSWFSSSEIFIYDTQKYDSLHDTCVWGYDFSKLGIRRDVTVFLDYTSSPEGRSGNAYNLTVSDLSLIHI